VRGTPAMLKVMIAEDDFTHADMVAQALTKGGYEVCGVVRTVREGIELGEEQMPDLAVIDVHLAEGGVGTAISSRLRRRGRLGVLYTTGDPGAVVLTYGDACLGKPFAPEDIVQALKIVEGTVGAEDIPQLPRRPQVLRYPMERRKGESAEMSAANLKIARLLLQQAALATFGTFAFRESDLGKILTEAARVCAECLGVRFCKICEYRPEKDDLLVVAGVGWHQGILGNVVSQADHRSPQGRAFITGKPMICHDLNEEPGFELPPIYAEHGIVSSVNVIIKGNGKPFGVLEIDSPEHYSYDEHDVDFLTGFANVLAEAVATTKRNALLRAALGRMKDLVDDKDQLLAENNVILIDKNRLLAEKTVLAHELQHRVRNNLQLVYGMLRTQHKDGQPDINSIARRVMTLAKVHDHLLGTGLTRTIDVGSYLESLCAGYRELEVGQGRDIDVICHAEPLPSTSIP
jgi:two-component sensor histidine kinase/CheY-like chemotaxis protein